MRKDPPPLSDLEICRMRVNATLAEYGCSIVSQDEFSGVLIQDNDTIKTIRD